MKATHKYSPISLPQGTACLLVALAVVLALPANGIAEEPAATPKENAVAADLLADLRVARINRATQVRRDAQNRVVLMFLSSRDHFILNEHEEFSPAEGVVLTVAEIEEDAVLLRDADGQLHRVISITEEEKQAYLLRFPPS